MKITRKELRSAIQKIILERIELNVGDVQADEFASGALTVKKTGTFADQMSYLHEQTIKRGSAQIKALGELLENRQFAVATPSKVPPAKKFTPNLNKSGKYFLFNSTHALTDPKNNYVKLNSAQEFLTYTGVLLSITNDNFGSKGDKAEFAVANLIAEAFPGITVGARTDISPGRDIDLVGKPTYFEVKFTDKKATEQGQIEEVLLDEQGFLTSYTIEYNTSGNINVNPQLSTGASPPTDNPNKYFILVTAGRGYLVSSVLLTDFLFLSTGNIPLNLDQNDPENIKSMQQLSFFIKNRRDAVKKMREFIAVGNLGSVDAPTYARKFIEFLNKDENEDARSLFKAFIFGSTLIDLSAGSSKLEDFDPTEHDKAKIIAHASIQEYLDGNPSDALSRKISAWANTVDFSDEDYDDLQSFSGQSIVDFREPNVKLKFNFSKTADINRKLVPFVRILGVTAAEEKGFVTGPTSRTGYEPGGIAIKARISTEIPAGTGGLKSFLLNDSFSLGQRISGLLARGYQQRFINSAEDTRTTLKTPDLNRTPRESGIPNFTKAVKQNTVLDDYNPYGALSVIASELAKNSKFFYMIVEEVVESNYGVITLKNDDIDKLFKCYCEKLSKVSPLSKQGERPDGNAYDDVLYDVFFDNPGGSSSTTGIIGTAGLFANYFVDSPGMEILYSCLEDEDININHDKFDDIDIIPFGENNPNYSLDAFINGPELTGLDDVTPSESYSDSIRIYDLEKDDDILEEDQKVQERRRIYALGESHASLLRKKYYGRR